MNVLLELLAPMKHNVLESRKNVCALLNRSNCANFQSINLRSRACVRDILVDSAASSSVGPSSIAQANLEMRWYHQQRICR